MDVGVYKDFIYGKWVNFLVFIEKVLISKVFKVVLGN